MIQKNDLVLEAFLSACKKEAPNISEDLLRKVYDIQVLRQFEKDREISLRETSRIVEEYLTGSGGQGGRA